jgi:hypothetical protein
VGAGQRGDGGDGRDVTGAAEDEGADEEESQEERAGCIPEGGPGAHSEESQEERAWGFPMSRSPRVCADAGVESCRGSCLGAALVAYLASCTSRLLSIAVLELSAGARLLGGGVFAAGSVGRSGGWVLGQSARSLAAQAAHAAYLAR